MATTTTTTGTTTSSTTGITPVVAPSPTPLTAEQYGSQFVNFYTQYLGIPTVTPIDVTPEEDITELETFEPDSGRGDAESNVLTQTSFQTGQSLVETSFGVPENYSQFNSYSDYLQSGLDDTNVLKDRVGFIGNVMEPITQGRWSDIDFAKANFGQMGKAAVADIADVASTRKTAGKIMGMVGGVPGAMVGSIVAGDTVRNAFGEASTRPAGILGIVSDAVHSIQYSDMASIRQARTEAFGTVAGKEYESGDVVGYNTAASLGMDLGFSFKMGSGGVTRAPGSRTYTGNMRGISQEHMMAIDAVANGYIPTGYNFSSGKSIEDAGWDNISDNIMDGYYTETGSFYSPRTNQFSAYGLAESRNAAAAKHGLSKLEYDQALSQARSGSKKLSDAIQDIKDRKTAAEQAAAKRAADAAAAKEAAERAAYQAELQARMESGDDGGGYDPGESAESFGGVSDGYGGGDARGGMIEHGRSQNRPTERNRNAYAMGTPPAGVQAAQSGFVDAPPSQVSEAAKVADNRPDSVPEGTYVLNAAAVEFAGEQDIRKMIMDAQKEAVRRGLSTQDFERHSDLVDIAVSSGEVKIAPHLVKIIGEDRLEKINKRGIRKTEQRIAENGQQPVQEAAAARGGMITQDRIQVSFLD